MEILIQNNNDHSPSFSDQVTAFLTAINTQSKQRSISDADLLAVIAIDSLINNLYSHNRNGEVFQPNSSSFYGWMSSSQMSVDQSNMSER